MKVTITEFGSLADVNGVDAPIGQNRLGSQLLTAAGNAAALNDDTNLIRVATDTAIHMKSTGGASSTSDEMIPANFVEWFWVRGGETLNIIAA